MEDLTLNLTRHYQILKPYLLSFSLDFKFLYSEIGPGEKCDLNYQVFKILDQIPRLFWSQGSRSRQKSKLLCLFTLRYRQTCTEQRLQNRHGRPPNSV